MSYADLSGSSGRSSMDQARLEELEALRPEEHFIVSDLPTTELPKRLPQMNTENWIQMSSLNGLTLTDEREMLSPLSPGGHQGAGGRAVASDSGVGLDESGHLQSRLCQRQIRRDNSQSLLPKPPSYWKFAVVVTLINPPLGLLSLFLCYLTRKDVERGHLLHAKKRSKQTLVLMMVAFSMTVTAIVLFVVIATARNEYPFRLEPTVTEHRKANKHGFELGYVPPPPVPRQEVGRPRYVPPPFIPRARKPVTDVLGDLARKWQGVNSTSFDFAQHDEVARFIETLDSSNSTLDTH